MKKYKTNTFFFCSTLTGGPKYEEPCTAHLAGSGTVSSGGGVIFSSTDHLLELEGKVKVDGAASTSSFGGGASGGTISVSAHHFDGHGYMFSNGGHGSTHSSSCNRFSSYTKHGGGGGGGHIRHFSPYPIRRDVLRHRNVRGGSGGASGGDGQICTKAICNQHGTFSPITDTCSCNAGYYGVDCAYHCTRETTCSGHGSCSSGGVCQCDDGFAGYRCEHRCHRNTTCNDHGRCSITGQCVCDPCYHGTNCQLQCSGNGNCIGNSCACKPCFVGTYCHSECTGHGRCVNSNCSCNATWKGDFCEVPKCPNDCSGNGICNAALLKCFCNPGWKGEDCGQPDCPGEPNCHNRGTCIIKSGTAVCSNCTKGWMGPACNNVCLHGNQIPMDSGNCQCDACWAGKGCDSLCMGRGACVNNKCECDTLKGWRGEVCQIPGCPGVNGDCSGHGDCDGITHTCTCYEGWTGVGCHIPDCPGAPNCFNRGVCNATTNPPSCQRCMKGWMGPACNDPCKFGEQIPMDSGNCVCEPGYTGVGCDSECSLHGKVVNGKCVCDIGWRGLLCDNPGCPGDGVDCTGHGECNSATHKCTCREGWTGLGCNIPDCPGTPNCINRGFCNSSFDPPKCTNCSKGFMGPACADPCEHGLQVPMDSGNCVCEPGWVGVGCDSECSGHGTIVNSVCKCHRGWRGTYCDNPGCPGIGSDCSDHGECNGATHECDCRNGWRGDGCEIPDCPGNPDCANRGNT